MKSLSKRLTVASLQPPPLQGSTLKTGFAAILLAAAGCDGSAQRTSATPEQSAVEIPTDIDRGPRIVNGTEVTHNDYPWMVALLNGSPGDAADNQFCGGSLIAKRWVLTAAHCVEDIRAGQVTTLTGRSVLSDNGGESIGVRRIIVHPDYTRNDYPDLALLELAGDSSAQVVSVPSLNYPAPAVREDAIVTGWGQIAENGPSSTELLETSLVITDHQSCARAYAENGIDIIEEAMVCAGTSNGNDSCYGDSGGPIFVKRENQFVQAGVVSFGEQCSLASHPGVYARVSTYYDWISSYANVVPYKGVFSENSGEGVTDQSDNTAPPVDKPVEPASPVVTEGFSYECNAKTCRFEAEPSQFDYFWDFDDGGYEFGRVVEHVFDYPGTYNVYLGTIDEQGEYQDFEREVTVKASNTTGTSTVTVESYTGRLSGRGDQHDLPEDGDPVSLPAGELNANLVVPENRRFRLYVDKYDPTTDEWYEIDRATARNGIINVQLPIESGEYGFTVLSLSQGGRYSLDVEVR